MVLRSETWVELSPGSPVPVLRLLGSPNLTGHDSFNLTCVRTNAFFSFEFNATLSGPSAASAS
jgi:hypothetical protein